MVGSRPTAHHNNDRDRQRDQLETARFFRTYLRKKLRSESSMALSLRSIGQVLFVA